MDCTGRLPAAATSAAVPDRSPLCYNGTLSHALPGSGSSVSSYVNSHLLQGAECPPLRQSCCFPRLQPLRLACCMSVLPQEALQPSRARDHCSSDCLSLLTLLAGWPVVEARCRLLCCIQNEAGLLQVCWLVLTSAALQLLLNECLKARMGQGHQGRPELAAALDGSLAGGAAGAALQGASCC